MAIIINGKKFSGKLDIKLFQQMIDKLDKLPEPKVHSLDETREKVSDEEILLIYQREMAYIDEFNPNNKFTKFGTINVVECIQGYIFSETETLGMHVDCSKDFNLKEQLIKFNDTTDIRIILVGGVPGKTSENNLENLFREILTVSEELKVNITIESQKILKRNAFNNDAKFTFVFDKILEKADILSRQLFKKPLNLAHFKNRRTADLKGRSVAENDVFMLTLAALAQASEMYKVSNAKLVEEQFLEFKKLASTEENFLKLIDLMFSKQGFYQFDSNYSKRKLYGEAKLTNIAFDTKTHEIYIISKLTSSLDRPLRDIVTLDSFQESSYHLVFDGKTGTYFKPQVSNKLMESCSQLSLKINKDNIINDSDIKDFCEVMEITENSNSINTIAKYVKYLEELKKCETSKPFFEKYSFFVSKDVFFQNYTINNKELAFKNLDILSKVFNCAFEGKWRRYPEFTLDALAFFDKGSNPLDMKKQLENKGITVHLTILPEGYYLCVPAINVKNYSQSIESIRQVEKPPNPFNLN